MNVLEGLEHGEEIQSRNTLHSYSSSSSKTQALVNTAPSPSYLVLHCYTQKNHTFLCKCHLQREHHKSACRIVQAFSYLSPTTHYSVQVCPRFRPRQLLCISLVRTKLALTCAEMWCTKDPLPRCLVLFFHEIGNTAIVCVYFCLNPFNWCFFYHPHGTTANILLT